MHVKRARYEVGLAQLLPYHEQHGGGTLETNTALVYATCYAKEGQAGDRATRNAFQWLGRETGFTTYKTSRGDRRPTRETHYHHPNKQQTRWYILLYADYARSIPRTRTLQPKQT